MNREQYYLEKEAKSKDLIIKTIDIFFKYDGNLTEIGKVLNKSKATDVTAESLVEEGIIGKVNDGIVVLATGKLDKKLNVKANRFTATAKEKIEALGGKAEVI